MKKKTQSPKLSLHRETLHNLQDSALAAAAGAAPTRFACTERSYCTPCIPPPD